MDYNELEIGDLVVWQNPNNDFKEEECRVVDIYYKDGGIITSDTNITILNENGDAYDVYACELDYNLY